MIVIIMRLQSPRGQSGRLGTPQSCVRVWPCCFPLSKALGELKAPGSGPTLPDWNRRRDEDMAVIQRAWTDLLCRHAPARRCPVRSDIRVRALWFAADGLMGWWFWAVWFGAQGVGLRACSGLGVRIWDLGLGVEEFGGSESHSCMHVTHHVFCPSDDMTWHGMTWYCMTCVISSSSYSAIPYIMGSAVLYSTWHDRTWHDLAWRDMAWHDMTWHDWTWHGMTGHDLTWLDMTWNDLTWLDMTWHESTWLDLHNDSPHDSTRHDTALRGAASMSDAMSSKSCSGKASPPPMVPAEWENVEAGARRTALRGRRQRPQKLRNHADMQSGNLNSSSNPNIHAGIWL